MVSSSPFAASQQHPASTKEGIYLYIEGDCGVDATKHSDDTTIMMDATIAALTEDDFHHTLILEDGALVPGGSLNLWSSEAMSLFAQYAAIGFLFSMLTGLQYPVYRRYLQLEGYQINSYTSLVNIAWSLKIFFGMLSDC
ncbi:hypothetical protein As57867_004440, partial [Aphanomyces stellatus]